MTRSFFALLFLTTLGFASPALADENLDHAKTLFNAGAQAYASGQFNAAIQAFDEANRIVPRPAIVFSLAQAHRRQYFLDRDPEHLHEAVKKYRVYIEQVPDGGRRSDAAQALAELQPLQDRVGPEVEGARRTPAIVPARIMVVTPTPRASMTIDGKGKKDLPFAAEVTPGKHRVHVSAIGYFDDDREVLALENTLIPVDVTLREKPALLTIEGTAKAEVSIDGRPLGATPFLGPIEVASGSHLIVVTKNGYKAFTQEVDLTRDQRKSLALHLEKSGQRVVATSLILGGGATLVAGAIFTVIAANEQADAQSILRRSDSGNISGDDRSAYISAKNGRDDWTKVAAVAYGAGGVAIATGLVFYAFDQPSFTLPQRHEEKPKTPSPSGEPTELSMIPLISPGFAGGSLTGRF